MSSKPSKPFFKEKRTTKFSAALHNTFNVIILLLIFVVPLLLGIPAVTQYRKNNNKDPKLDAEGYLSYFLGLLSSIAIIIIFMFITIWITNVSALGGEGINKTVGFATVIILFVGLPFMWYHKARFGAVIRKNAPGNFDPKKDERQVLLNITIASYLWAVLPTALLVVILMAFVF